MKTKLIITESLSPNTRNMNWLISMRMRASQQPIPKNVMPLTARYKIVGLVRWIGFWSSQSVDLPETPLIA